MPAARTSVPQTWDPETQVELLKAMNLHYHPNMEDCKQLAVVMHAKGYKMSDGAILHFSPKLDDWRAIVATLRGQGYTFSESALQPTNWDHEAHLALLQAVVSAAAPNAAEWEKILAEVAQKGYIYTSSAALFTSPQETARHSPTYNVYPAYHLQTDKMSERTSWDEKANHDLLMSLVTVMGPTQENLRQVMVKMHELGYSCTLKAITYLTSRVAQHLQKLRRKETAAAAASPAGKKNGEPSTAAKATPKKRGAAGPAATSGPGSAKTPGSNKKKPLTNSAIVNAFMDDGEDDDEEFDEFLNEMRPKKRVKREPGIKQEPEDMKPIIKKENGKGKAISFDDDGDDGDY
ncbi:hypothetical protein OQA88_12216 [Cercophora sp. LCS_1]